MVAGSAAIAALTAIAAVPRAKTNLLRISISLADGKRPWAKVADMLDRVWCFVDRYSHWRERYPMMTWRARVSAMNSQLTSGTQLVVNAPGTPKSLHQSNCPLDSRRLVYRIHIVRVE
jgi:hypothetical protein